MWSVLWHLCIEVAMICGIHSVGFVHVDFGIPPLKKLWLVEQGFAAVQQRLQACDTPSTAWLTWAVLPLFSRVKCIGLVSLDKSGW